VFEYWPDIGRRIGCASPSSWARDGCEICQEVFGVFVEYKKKQKKRKKKQKKGLSPRCIRPPARSQIEFGDEDSALGNAVHARFEGSDSLICDLARVRERICIIGLIMTASLVGGGVGIAGIEN